MYIDKFKDELIVDQLVLQRLCRDVKSYLSGKTDLLESARQSVSLLREEVGLTPYELSKVFEVNLSELLPLLF